VNVAPTEIKLWFSEKLESALSKVQVFAGDGKLVEQQAQRPGADAAIVIVSVPPLKPGKYKVLWKAVSVDTHITKGDFTFEVVRSK
jgi:copper resistance protein C